MQTSKLQLGTFERILYKYELSTLDCRLILKKATLCLTTVKPRIILKILICFQVLYIFSYLST